MTPVGYSSLWMEEATPELITITDWFVMEGAEVVFSPGMSSDEDGFHPELHEVRIDDLHIFIGEPTRTSTREVAAEVAAVLRVGIPLPTDVVKGTLGEFDAGLPSGLWTEVIEDPVDGSCAIWLIVTIDRRNLEDGTFFERLEELLRVAESPAARAIREQIN